MRQLTNNEIATVSGGTFCLIGGLVRSVFSIFSYKNRCNSGYSKGGHGHGRGC